jgi:hypothetical protein
MKLLIILHLLSSCETMKYFGYYFVSLLWWASIFGYLYWSSYYDAQCRTMRSRRWCWWPGVGEEKGAQTSIAEAYATVYLHKLPIILLFTLCVCHGDWVHLQFWNGSEIWLHLQLCCTLKILLWNGFLFVDPCPCWYLPNRISCGWYLPNRISCGWKGFAGN